MKLQSLFEQGLRSVPVVMLRSEAIMVIDENASFEWWVEGE